MALKINKKSTDAELVKAMADGEMEAFAEIYNRWSPVLRRFVTGLIKNRVKAEDIVQNIFMKMMSTRPVFDNESALKGWLFVCARNEVISTLRSKWESDVDKVVTYPEVSSDGIGAENLRPILELALKKMPEKRSEVFRLSRLEGMSDQDIADQLGISVRTVQKHLEVAGKDIRKLLN